MQKSLKAHVYNKIQLYTANVGGTWALHLMKRAN